MIVLTADLSDCSKIAELHRDSIQEGFVSRLGVPFLTLLYQALLKFSGGILLVAKKDQLLLGFVAGVVNTSAFYKYFLRYHFIGAGSLIIPALFKQRCLSGILESLHYTRKVDQPHLPEAELISIAVRPEYRGQGIADQLFDALRAYFKNKGITEFRIVMGAGLSRAQKFYERKGCDLRDEIEVHRGVHSMVYTCNISK